MTFRRPPTEPLPHLYSPTAERALLAALLLDSDTCWAENVATLVQPGDFMLDELRFAYRAALWLRERDILVTVPTLAWALEQMGLIGQTDGLTNGTESWLVGIVAEWYTAVGSSAHARIIADYSRRRGMIRSAEAMAQEALGPSAPAVPINARPEYQNELEP